MTFSHHDFKQCLGKFPSGVTVVTTMKEGGTPLGATISSFCSVSLEPPMVLYCLDKKTYDFEHYTTAQHFAVNILSEKQTDISQKFSFEKESRWQEVEYHHEQTDAPLLKDVIAYLECKKEHCYDGGDHAIIVGRVVNLKVLSDEKPLVYYHSSYQSIKDLVS